MNAPDLSLFKGRDVRQEINEQIDAHVDKLPDFSNMTPDDFNTPIDDAELTDEEQEATYFNNSTYVILFLFILRDNTNIIPSIVSKVNIFTQKYGIF